MYRLLIGYCTASVCKSFWAIGGPHVDINYDFCKFISLYAMYSCAIAVACDQNEMVFI